MKTIKPGLEIYDDERHCCDISAGSGPRNKCEFMTSPTYCSIFKQVLKRDPDLFATIKCDQCKAESKEKPKVIVLCGSTRYCQQMAVVAWYLEKEEGAIVMGLHLLPWWYPDCPDDHLAEHEDVKEQMDNLHMRKIDLADEIFVVDVDCYTGNSTKREVAYAINRGLPIRYYSAEPMGLRVDGERDDAILKAQSERA